MSALLDFEALKDLDSIIKTHEGNQFFFRQSEIQKGQPIYVRLLLPFTYSGRWFLQTFDHWLKIEGNEKKVKVPSPVIIGEADYIDQALEQVKKSGNPQAEALIKNDEYYTKQQSFLFNCLILENVQYNNFGQIVDYTVKNNKPCVFTCSAQILKQITGYIIHPQFNRPSGKSIADPEMGITLTISKEESGLGAKKKTDYKVIAVQQPHAIDASWEAAAEDLLGFQKRQMYSDKYMHSLVNQFFTGQPTMTEPEYRFPELRENKDAAVAAPAVASFTLPPVSAPVFAAAPVAPPVAPPPASTPAPAAMPVFAAPVAAPVEVGQPVVTPPVPTPPVVGGFEPGPIVNTQPEVTIPLPKHEVADELPASVGNPKGMGAGAPSLADLLKASMNG